MALKTFPTLVGLTYPVVKTPTWVNAEQRAISGKRTTIGYYTYPYYAVELAYEVLRSDIANLEFQTLVAFFNSVGARRDLWQFSDPDDNAVTAQPFGAGDGVKTQFQLVRTMQGKVGYSWDDPVFAPISATIYDNGVAKTVNVDYTLGDYGVVTFVTPPASGHALTWTGTYYWLCRFDQDSADFSQFAHNFFELKKIKFSTEKLP